MILTSIPSPPVGVWYLGPIPIRAYSILMVCAIALAAWITYRRYVKRGGLADVAYDTFFWAIPFGIVGARLYHVVTHWGDFFYPGADPWAIFKTWEGGIAIWGAIGFGAVGAFIGLRRAGQRVGPFADSLAPGLLIAQVLGRVGNYFNQELYGGPTDLPWGLEISPERMVEDYPPGTLFHPTFLYEGLWNTAGALILLWLDRRFKFKSGQIMALYMVIYGSGRFWIEQIRTDFSYAFLGIRTNAWTALLAVALGLLVFFIAGRIGAPSQVDRAERLRYFELRAERKGESIPESELAEATLGDTSDAEDSAEHDRLK
ncbi:prolipoprotein diacylglyceryl transferase [Actinomycetaceae bacterium WB03_NA08]|uniref:Phosphatidylglycerol--prolipoprotein diacylglyceryl transferase n=1 Tax=Scrofimicrobium canadense TaxID=2652290 RepID=A0A6N7W6Y8_9ACTO|nr:prolipoprotein diacylglyceryl transferase [Scrofimicrobium canadense]MSS83996.1 prolipoprotein diacylglyceryl transferase [Scrofimicrobium canadense]